MKEQIMDILMNYLPKEGVSKTRDRLYELLTSAVNVGEDLNDFITRKDGWFNGLKMDIYSLAGRVKNGDTITIVDLEELDAGLEMLTRRLLKKIEELPYLSRNLQSVKFMDIKKEEIKKELHTIVNRHWNMAIIDGSYENQLLLEKDLIDFISKLNVTPDAKVGETVSTTKDSGKLDLMESRNE